MPVLLDSSGGCERLDVFAVLFVMGERLDVFAVPFVMGAAGDVSEGEVGEDFRFCSS